MLSACANPIIYGFLNENFHREFIDIFDRIRKAIEYVVCVHARTSNGNVSSSQNDEGIPNDNNQRRYFTIKDYLTRCCRTRQEEPDSYENGMIENRHSTNIALRRLKGNQHSFGASDTVLGATPTVKCNGIKDINEESGALLPKNKGKHVEKHLSL